MTVTPFKRDDRARQNLRLEPDLWLAIDKARLRRPGSVSRNTWIAEAILEKVQREAPDVPPERIRGRNA
jgi:hypothetical protein